MYEAHWGLNEKPFENTPDPRFIYYSQQHQEAFSRLLYVVNERKGSALLTGEYGCGKTLVSHVLLQELQKESQNKAVYIFNPRLSSLDLVREIVYQLQDGKEPPANKIDLFHALHRILLSNYEVNRHNVIIIDEAQAIVDGDIFEELRLLLNFQLNNMFLLTIILFGQPDLIDMVLNLPQLKQRIAVRFHLRALNEEETKQYIQRRLEVAGVKHPIFDDDAYREIYLKAFGVPRQINNICDLALLAGYGSGVKNLNRDVVMKVSEDLDGCSPRASQSLKNERPF